MITLDDVFDVRAEMYDKSLDLIRTKGHDYNKKQQESGDTLFNLRVAALLGIVNNPEGGILVRLADKFMRLCSLVGTDSDPMVKDESIEDTILDIHNYSDYLVAFMRERKRLASKDRKKKFATRVETKKSSNKKKV